MRKKRLFTSKADNDSKIRLKKNIVIAIGISDQCDIILCV